MQSTWGSPTAHAGPAPRSAVTLRAQAEGTAPGQVMRSPHPYYWGVFTGGSQGWSCLPSPWDAAAGLRAHPCPPGGVCTSPSCIFLPQHDGPRPPGFQFRSQAPCRTGGFVGTKRRLPPSPNNCPPPPGRHCGIPQPAAGRASSGPFLVGTFPGRTGGIIACKKTGEREGRERICYTALP